jgi:hypothetical protein
VTDLLDRAEQRLSDLLKTHASRKVRYSRGAKEVEVDATVGKSEFESAAPDGVFVVQVETRDYLIQAADLVLDGTRIVPAIGDRIREEVAGETIVCEVMTPPGQAHFRWCDPAHTTLRIHTKQVGTE